MSNKLVIVLDCGATNVRAIAVDSAGKVIAKASMPNETESSRESTSRESTSREDTSREDSDWHIWPVDNIFARFCQCVGDILPTIQPEQVAAITVTTFGVDGTLIDVNGQPLYPVISWKCPRTSESQQNLQNYLDPEAAAVHSGVGHFGFNTINKLVWFKENRPELLDDAHAWLFISSMFNHKLTGRLTTDATMAGTSQLTDLSTQQFSPEILGALDLDESLFPPIVEAGSVIGELLPDAAQMLGLPTGIPVISAGHDTQFAVFGSGAKEGQPILSSGTWEILMARSPEARGLTPELFEHGFTCEWDSHKNKYNPGIQWLASGVLEWVGQQFYAGLEGDSKYEQMIKEAAVVKEGSDGVFFNPSFLPDRFGKTSGAIEGLSLNTSRGAIYRAALEALCNKLKTSLNQLESIGGFEANELILVGGGSKNRLWNQIKADTLQLPVKVLQEPETTVLGAAMFAMAGAGIFNSPNAARDAFNIQYDTILPSQLTLKNK